MCIVEASLNVPHHRQSVNTLQWQLEREQPTDCLPINRENLLPSPFPLATTNQTLSPAYKPSLSHLSKRWYYTSRYTDLMEGDICRTERAPCDWQVTNLTATDRLVKEKLYSRRQEFYSGRETHPYTLPVCNGAKWKKPSAFCLPINWRTHTCLIGHVQVEGKKKRANGSCRTDKSR